MAVTFHGLKEEEANLLKSLQQGGEVTVGLVPVQPYVMDCFGQNSCHQPGLGVELVKEVCCALAINCRLIKETDTKWGDNFTLGNGEWQGMIRYIMDQKYNTAMPAFNPTASRLDVVDFSISIYNDFTSFVTRFPNPTLLSSTSLFTNYKVMIPITTTFLILGFLSVFFDTVKYEVQKHSFKCANLCSLQYWQNFIRATLDAAALIVNQGPDERYNHSLAYYVLFTIWGLCCVVLIEVYISFILAGAFTIERKLPFTDTETLANCIQDGGCKMVAKTTSASYYERIFAAESGSMFLLKNALQQHQTVIIKEGTEPGDMILDENQIYNVIILSSGRYSQMVQQHEPCSFDHVQMEAADPLTFPFHKGSKLRPLFDQAIISLREAGIIKKLYNKYIGELINNDHCRASAIGAQQMDLSTFTGALWTLLAGAAIAGAILILERFIASRNSKKASRCDENGIEYGTSAQSNEYWIHSPRDTPVEVPEEESNNSHYRKTSKVMKNNFPRGIRRARTRKMSTFSLQFSTTL